MADEEWQEDEPVAYVPPPREHHARVFRPGGGGRGRGDARRDDGNNFRRRDDGDYQRRDGGGGGGGNFQRRDDGGNFQRRNEGGSFQRDGGNFQRREEGGNFQRREEGGNFQRRDNYQRRDDGGFFGRRDDRSSNSNWRSDDGNKKVITIPSDKVGRVIGKGGSKIRELEYESEAKVKIGDSGGSETEITLIGTDAAIARVEGMINELTEERPPRQQENASYSSDNQSTGEFYKKVITIPSDKVGRVIGKGGSKIRELEYESEAKVKIGDSGGSETEITLAGTDAAVAKVEGMIIELTEERPPRDNQSTGEFYNMNADGMQAMD